MPARPFPCASLPRYLCVCLPRRWPPAGRTGARGGGGGWRGGAEAPRAADPRGGAGPPGPRAVPAPPAGARLPGRAGGARGRPAARGPRDPGPALRVAPPRGSPREPGGDSRRRGVRTGQRLLKEAESRQSPRASVGGDLDPGDAHPQPGRGRVRGLAVLVGGAGVAGTWRGAWGAPGLEATDRGDPGERQGVRSFSRGHLVAAGLGPQRQRVTCRASPLLPGGAWGARSLQTAGSLEETCSSNQRGQSTGPRGGGYPNPTHPAQESLDSAPGAGRTRGPTPTTRPVSRGHARARAPAGG